MHACMHSLVYPPMSSCCRLVVHYSTLSRFWSLLVKGLVYEKAHTLGSSSFRSFSLHHRHLHEFILGFLAATTTTTTTAAAAAAAILSFFWRLITREKFLMWIRSDVQTGIMILPLHRSIDRSFVPSLTPPSYHDECRVCHHCCQQKTFFCFFSQPLYLPPHSPKGTHTHTHTYTHLHTQLLVRFQSISNFFFFSSL